MSHCPRTSTSRCEPMKTRDHSVRDYSLPPRLPKTHQFRVSDLVHLDTTLGPVTLDRRPSTRPAKRKVSYIPGEDMSPVRYRGRSVPTVLPSFRRTHGTELVSGQVVSQSRGTFVCPFPTTLYLPRRMSPWSDPPLRRHRHCHQ